MSTSPSGIKKTSSRSQTPGGSQNQESIHDAVKQYGKEECDWKADLIEDTRNDNNRYNADASAKLTRIDDEAMKTESMVKKIR